MTKNISYASWLATKDVLIKEYEEEEAKRRADTLKKAKEEAAAAGLLFRRSLPDGFQLADERFVCFRNFS